MKLKEYDLKKSLSYVQLAKLMVSFRVTCTNPDTFQNLFAGTEFSFVHLFNQN